jgi:hypothetical protein
MDTGFYFFTCSAIRKRLGREAECNGILAGVKASQKDDLILYCGKCRRFFAFSRRDGIYYSRMVKPSQLVFRFQPHIPKD